MSLLAFIIYTVALLTVHNYHASLLRYIKNLVHIFNIFAYCIDTTYCIRHHQYSLKYCNLDLRLMATAMLLKNSAENII